MCSQVSKNEAWPLEHNRVSEKEARLQSVARCLVMKSRLFEFSPESDNEALLLSM